METVGEGPRANANVDALGNRRFEREDEAKENKWKVTW